MCDDISVLMGFYVGEYLMIYGCYSMLRRCVICDVGYGFVGHVM